MNTWPNKVIQLWDRLWLVSSSANNLAAYRIILSFYMLWKCLSYDIYHFFAFPPIMFERYCQSDALTNIYAKLAFPGLAMVGIPEDLYFIYLGITCLLLLFALLGLWGRIACFASAIAILPLMMMENLSDGIGTIGHEVAIPLFFVLAASRCTDALSVESWLRSRKLTNSLRSWEYGWPLRVGMFTLAMIYFYTGLTKVKSMGLSDFIEPGNMERILLWASQYRPGLFPGMGDFLLSYRWLLPILASYTLMVELGFPIAFFWPRTKRIFLVSGLLFQTGIFMTFSLIFMDLIVYYSAYIDWENVWRSLRRNLFPSIQRCYVFYDGDCSLCEKSLSGFLKYGSRFQLSFIPTQRLEDFQKTGIENIDRERLQREMLLYESNGELQYWGFDAWRRMLIIIPLFRILGLLMALPIIHTVGSQIYKMIARNRSVFSLCNSGICEVQGK